MRDPMKKLAFLFSVLLVVASASAHAFPVQAYVTWTPNRVDAQVFNRFGFPIVCQVNLSAIITYCNGAQAPQWQNVILPPTYPGFIGTAYIFQHQFCAVYSSAWAAVDCRPAY